MPPVVVRPRALTDLAETWTYIAADSEKQADTFIDLIDRKFQALGRRPEIGRSRSEPLPELRSLVMGNYVIFYIHRTGAVEIIRVLHGSRDVSTIFEAENK